MSHRRTELREQLPGLVSRMSGHEGVHLSAIYSAVEEHLPHLVDNEPDSPPSTGLNWQHELRWELETLVGTGAIRRRKDLGRGMYSVG